MLDTVDQIVSLAKEAAAAGKMAEVTRLGQKLPEVIEQCNPQAREYTALQALERLYQQVFALLALVGKLGDLSPRERRAVRTQALERAREVDTSTDRLWELEAWVKTVLEESGGWHISLAGIRHRVLQLVNRLRIR
ncbi:MAG: hypothetical protein ACREOH_00350 [Candidatus Entotheonellia bacterium]